MPIIRFCTYNFTGPIYLKLNDDKEVIAQKTRRIRQQRLYKSAYLLLDMRAHEVCEFKPVGGLSELWTPVRIHQKENVGQRKM